MTQFTSPEAGTRSYIVENVPLKVNVCCPVWVSRFLKHGL